MKQQHMRTALATAALAVISLAAIPAAAQTPVDDPFYRAPPKPAPANPKPKVVEPAGPQLIPFPTIAQRTQDYQLARQRAVQAKQPAPNPVGQFLVSELNVIGVFETERGVGVFVEATPTKQTFFITPGTRLYNGELLEMQPGTFSQPARAVVREQID